MHSHICIMFVFFLLCFFTLSYKVFSCSCSVSGLLFWHRSFRETGCDPTAYAFSRVRDSGHSPRQTPGVTSAEVHTSGPVHSAAARFMHWVVSRRTSLVRAEETGAPLLPELRTKNQLPDADSPSVGIKSLPAASKALCPLGLSNPILNGTLRSGVISVFFS